MNLPFEIYKVHHRALFLADYIKKQGITDMNIYYLKDEDTYYVCHEDSQKIYARRFLSI